MTTAEAPQTEYRTSGIPMDVPPMPEDPYAIDIEDIDVAQPWMFEKNLQWDYFARMRKEAPIHHASMGEYGPYWSLFKFDDIQYVDTHHREFSSEPSIVYPDQEAEFQTPMFIAMDPPEHDVQRKTVAGVAGPRNLEALKGLIRERVQNILDSLPVNETFNWVDKVSIELTTQMLATLFDFPFEDRAKLTYWSDVTTARVEPGGLVESVEQRQQILLECLQYFGALWKERAEKEPGNDLISMMAHSEDTKHMQPMEYLGNLMLLIVGGNDTTRNSISAGVLALNQFPDQYEKLKADTSLIPNMVSEVIRWQTPLAYMRRRVVQDMDYKGHQFKEGDRVLMWYASGNRDEDVFPDGDKLIIDRENARRHMAFGFGIHRCMGNRLAEMQLRILWEEIMERFDHIEVVGDPVRVRSSFVQGYSELPVRIHA